MNDKKKIDYSQIDITKRMAAGIKRGVSKALERHKKLGESVVILKDGKVVEVPPEEIEVPHFPEDWELENL